MCGILAIFGDDLPPAEQAGTALDLLRHRGPNDRGVWQGRHAWLGSRRLSIIDLGPGGHQPMIDPKTGVVLIFNGEIYNYRELRDQLIVAGHRFRSQSDTEVLLHAYIQWGQACLSHLNGMWAFAVWDPRTGHAFFARDRFGVKPLYYAMVCGTLAIASEPKAILSLYPELRRVDDQALYQLLVKGQLHGGHHSFYAGLHVLAPGHCGTFVPGSLEPDLATYWTLPATDDPCLDGADALDHFQALFEDATRLRVRSDVPLGVTLSGGLDSTAVLHAVQLHLDRPWETLTAFTSTYREGHTGAIDERAWAHRAAAPYPTVRLEEIEATADDWLDVLRRIVYHMDGPGYCPAVFPLWQIVKSARERNVPVLLEGQGGDELLGGYGHHSALAVVDSLRHSVSRPDLANLKQLVGTIAAGRRTFSASTLLMELTAESFPALKTPYWRQVGALGTLRSDYAQAMAATAEPPPLGAADISRRGFERALLLDFSRDILPGLLQYGDAISMAHSVENRLPFLDYRLVEFCFRLPPDSKIGKGETKRILRRYLRRAGQNDIANRRDKRGYPTPVDRWLASSNGALPREILLAGDARIRQYCSQEKIRHLIDNHVNGRFGVGNHLYRLLSTELWLQECATVAAPAPRCVPLQVGPWRVNR